MTDNSFANPAAIPFNSAGSSVTVATNFGDIFVHSSTTDCPVTSCTLKEVGCLTALAAQSDVVLGADPYGITAVETNVVGYSLTFCYECVVTPTSGSPITFTKDSITVTQNPLDCSIALTDNGYTPPPIPYNSVGS